LNPSVKRRTTGVRIFRAGTGRSCRWYSRARLVAARSSQVRAPWRRATSTACRKHLSASPVADDASVSSRSSPSLRSSSARHHPSSLRSCQRLQYLAERYLLAGRPDEAKRAADQALELAREREKRGFEAWTLRLQAEIAATAMPPDEVAETRYPEAMALATELEMRPLVAHCHLGLGSLHRRTGDTAKARAHLTTAAAMYCEMDMGFWMEKVETELRP
jgi:hypothetical protein